MKKLLLLSLISLKLCAGIVEDLETAIVESDLPAVEQLLACNPPIDREEKYALIELATDILHDYENMKDISNLRIWQYDETNPKFIEMNEKRDFYRDKIKTFLYLQLGTVLAHIALYNSHLVSPDTADIISSTNMAIFGGVCLYYIVRYFRQKRNIKNECRTHFEELWQNAVKIRQLLYKI